MWMTSAHFRSLLVLLTLIVLPGLVEAQTCVPAPGGIVGWWPANGTAEDVIAGNDGTLAGDATYGTGAVGQGFSLDGFGDYVQISDSAALRPAHVSVEAWVRFDSLDTPIVSEFGAPGLQYIVFKKNSRVFNFEAYALRKQRDGEVDRLAFSIADVNGQGGTSVAFSTTPVVVGEFYHVVGSYDGSRVRLYVNGSLEADMPLVIDIDYGDRPVFLGTSGETVFDGKLAGIIDEASIYNRALELSEVACLYAAGSAGKCPSVTGLLMNLSTFVRTLNLSNGIANSLDTKLQRALEALDAANEGNFPSACGKLRAFVNEVAAQTGKSVTQDQAVQLTDLAQQVMTALACK